MTQVQRKIIYPFCKITSMTSRFQDERDGHGFTLLHKAAADHENDTVLFLLEHGANPRLNSNEEHSTLQFAMQSRGQSPNYSHVPPFEMLEKLLEYGADANAKLNKGGTTVFHKILQHGDQDVVKLFVRYGGRFGTEKKGKAVRQFAAKNKDPAVLEIVARLQAGEKM